MWKGLLSKWRSICISLECVDLYFPGELQSIDLRACIRYEERSCASERQLWI